jgi:hypothetical protein
MCREKSKNIWGNSTAEEPLLKERLMKTKVTRDTPQTLGRNSAALSTLLIYATVNLAEANLISTSVRFFFWATSQINQRLVTYCTQSS